VAGPLPVGRQTGAIIADFQHQRAAVGARIDVDAARAAVAQRIRGRLLHDAERRQRVALAKVVRQVAENQAEFDVWVLAVGYPLSLETTVTAGIISATGRNIGVGTRHVKDGEVAQRSFIQTDAAVNSGNSGGALINTNGELIGMNTAIMSPTGTYAGYSFAIPVNVLKKAVKEIIQSNDMQRGS